MTETRRESEKDIYQVTKLNGNILDGKWAFKNYENLYDIIFYYPNSFISSSTFTLKKKPQVEKLTNGKKQKIPFRGECFFPFNFLLLVSTSFVEIELDSGTLATSPKKTNKSKYKSSIYFYGVGTGSWASALFL